MKILILIPHLGSGGAQQVFRDQLKFYASHFQTVGCIFNWEGALESDHKLSIVSLDVPAGRNWLEKAYFFCSRVIRLRQVKKKYGIDICISHLEGADYVNILSKKDEKVFCWIHGTKEFDGNIEGAIGWFRKRILIPFLYKGGDLLVTVSEGIRLELVSRFNLHRDRIKTVVNGFDLQEIKDKAAATTSVILQDLTRGNPILITHCRLARQKNLDALLMIFSVLKKTREARLFILGDGELRETLLMKAMSCSLKTYSVWKDMPLTNDYDVYFMGYQSNPYTYVKQATVYLMTSSWEGFPLSLCEAMACGVPVMATDCYTGPREIIAPELQSANPITRAHFSDHGILMPIADTNSISLWVNTIVSVLEDQELRMKLATRGKDRIRDFDKENITRQWLKIIE